MKINELKELKGSIKTVKLEVNGEEKLHLKWIDNPEAKFLSDTKILEEAKKGRAFTYEGKLIKNCKELFLIFMNEDREKQIDKLPTKKVDMDIDF